ncbi:hypothetical protein AXG93_1913s1910 [Marchantia polymorpha subsp. ruderalis]|uniref:Reverse transcriptase domain-containing protein n=1 Tax=Marchantia polymorpha subsp. ruderalis TaxID=1480154 RepID=A0A176WJ88_MARPO|nr:hypothetical protein AXG93_1913s1910 [Marchantia polymorpha subsp. ruderalis]
MMTLIHPKWARNITILHDVSITRVTDQDVIEATALTYYITLYATVEPSIHQQHAELELLGIIPATFTARFPPAILDELGRESTSSEVFKALKEMSSSKTPGPDGVLTEFYVKFWDVIQDDFMTMLSTAIRSDTLPLGMNCGLTRPRFIPTKALPPGMNCGLTRPRFIPTEERKP